MRFASQILVLQQGRIVEQGTYDALMMGSSASGNTDAQAQQQGTLTASNVMVASGQVRGQRRWL